MMRQPRPFGAGAAKWLNASWRKSVNCADHRSTLKCTTSANLPILRPKRKTSHRAGSAGWWLASGTHWWYVDPAMSVFNTDIMMGQPFDVQVTGEPRDTETVTRGSERGRWKSTHQGNSLASYSTLVRFWRGVGTGNLPAYSTKHFSRPAPALDQLVVSASTPRAARRRTMLSQGAGGGTLPLAM